MRNSKKVAILICLLLLLQFIYFPSYGDSENLVNEMITRRQIYFMADNLSFLHKLISSSGYQAIGLENKDFKSNFKGIHTILIEGKSLELSTEQISQLKSFVQSGGNLAIWGHKDLAGAFDISFEKPATYKNALEVINSSMDIFWPEPVLTAALSPQNDQSIFTVFKPSSHIAVAGYTEGTGKVLYAVDPVYQTASHDFLLYPYLMKHLEDFFEISSPIRVDDIRVYMDWGFHYNESLQILVKTLVQAGVSEVHLSAWYEVDRVKSFFDTFITLCHANGIRVYAWLELPMVTKEFWDENPQARQKLLSGQDAIIGWRALIAMEDPQVNVKVKEKVNEILSAFNFDGANLAELYFEPAGGLDLVEDITPFSDYFTQSFTALYGVAPQDIFNMNSNLSNERRKSLKTAFISERIKIITDLNQDYVHFIKSKHPELDIYVTVIDDSIDRRITDYIGSDSQKIMKAINDPSVKLQIEDPFNLWDVGSSRYIQIGDHFSANLPDNFESIDINVVSRPYAFPTHKQTGAEFDLIVFDGSKKMNNVQLYAFNTVTPMDLLHAPYVLGGHIHIMKLGDTFIFDAPAPFYLEGDYKGLDVFLNNKRWPFHSESSVWIPRGQSFLSVEPIQAKGPGSFPLITKFTGQFTDYSVTDQSFTLKYSSERKDYLSTKTYMDVTFVDQTAFSPQVFFNGQDFTYVLPPGEHTITLMQTDGPKKLLVYEGAVLNFAQPLIEVENDLLVPGIPLLESIGATYDHHTGYRTLSANYKNYAFWIQADKALALANGADHVLMSNARVIDGDFYLPLRFIVQAFNLSLSEQDGIFILSH